LVVRAYSPLHAGCPALLETATEARSYPFSSFGAYFDLIERGGHQPGWMEYAVLPEDEAETGRPIEVPVEILFGSGRK